MEPTASDKPKADKIVELREVYKCFWVGDMPFPALNGVNLNIRRGELVVIAGRSLATSAPCRASRRKRSSGVARRGHVRVC